MNVNVALCPVSVSVIHTVVAGGAGHRFASLAVKFRAGVIGWSKELLDPIWHVEGPGRRSYQLTIQCKEGIVGRSEHSCEAQVTGP